MKYLLVAFLSLVFVNSSFAQSLTIKNPTQIVNANILFNDDDEHRPQFPGGIQGFYKYIGKNLKYPEVARLIGIDGRLIVSFVINKNGHIVEATPKNCIGAGCEAEAVRVLEASPPWKPGTQHGKPVGFVYSVPITFSFGKEKTKIYFDNLRKSNYGFVFSIKNTLYTINEAEKILGQEFDPTQIKIAEPFYNYNKVAKFDMPDKKEVYLLIFKPAKD